MEAAEVRSKVFEILRQKNVTFSGNRIKDTYVSFYMIKTPKRNKDIDDLCADISSETGLKVEFENKITRRLGTTRESVVLNIYL